MARTIISRTSYSDVDLSKRVAKCLSKYVTDVNNEKRLEVLTKELAKISEETKQTYESSIQLDERIRKICEKAKQNIVMSSSPTPFEKTDFWNPRLYDKRKIDYSKSYSLQAMCNEINFFKEDAKQIGRTFGPYTFRGWIGNESDIKRGMFTKPNDCDTYFSKQFNQLVIYDKTEKIYVRVPLLTPFVDNEDFFNTSLDILCNYLKNTGVPKSGDVFGYFTVDFCGFHNRYYEKNANATSIRKPYHVDILYNDISYKQVNCIKMWRWESHTPINYEPLNMLSKAPLLVYKGVNVDKKEEMLGNVYFNKETNKYEIFDGYFWQEVDYNNEFVKLKTEQWGKIGLNDLHRNNCGYVESKDFDKYNYTNMFNYENNKSQTSFKENCVYLLKRETLDGSEQQEKTYLLVKYIHDIFGIVLDCLVVKQLSGNNEKIFTLTKSDCSLLEIKYQSGLQILPAQLNWEPVKEKHNNSD